MASHHLGAVASPRNKWWLHITLARSAPTTYTQLWYAWTHTCKCNSLYNHNSQFSSYIYHKSYESTSVQYSRHIFITNHMNPSQCNQVIYSSRIIWAQFSINRWHQSSPRVVLSTYTSTEIHIFITNHMNAHLSVPTVQNNRVVPSTYTSIANHIFITNHMNAHHKFSIKA